MSGQAVSGDGRHDALSCRLADCPDPSRLAAEWLALQERARASVFLSWPWIAALLAAGSDGFTLARIEADGRLLGLALLGGRRGRRHLNESGDAVRDRVTIEYNGVLAEAGFEAEAAGSLLAALGESGHSLSLGGVAPEWQHWCAARDWRCRLLRAPQPAPFLRLERLDADGLPAALSRNGRAQLRRSLRHLARFGEVRLERAGDAAEALDWFAGLERLHDATWRARGCAGAFVDPSFADFHRHLIGRFFASGVPDLMRLTAGDRVLGYLYLLRWRGAAHAYQGGFDLSGGGDWRPGLIAHLLAIRLYRDEGLRLYRFLAGAARYKSRFADGADTLLWMRAEPAGRLDRLARRLRGRR